MSDKLGRHWIVEPARRDFVAMLLEWQNRHDITQAEGAEIQASALANSLTWIVKSERDGGSCNKCGEFDILNSDKLCSSCSDELDAKLAEED